MDWSPQDEPLRQLIFCLRDSLNGFDRNLQKQAEQVSFFFFCPFFTRSLFLLFFFYAMLVSCLVLFARDQTMMAFSRLCTFK